MKYNIYAGLSGQFGGPVYIGTGDFSNYDSAIDYAYQMAIEEYESYEGYHGIMSWYDIAREENLDVNEDIEEIDSIYNEEREQWLEYDAILTSEDNLDEEIVEI